MKRDLYLFETQEQIEEMYKLKYIPGQQIYLKEENPKEKSNVVFFNDMCQHQHTPDLYRRYASDQAGDAGVEAVEKVFKNYFFL